LGVFAAKGFWSSIGGERTKLQKILGGEKGTSFVKRSRKEKSLVEGSDNEFLPVTRVGKNVQ